MEYDLEEKKKEMRLKGEIIDDEENYEILSDTDDPSLCKICSKSIDNPMSTKCGHIFCEKCILKHIKSKAICPECKEPTNGILNDAAKILNDKIRKRNESKSAREKQRLKDQKCKPVSGWLIP